MTLKDRLERLENEAGEGEKTPEKADKVPLDAIVSGRDEYGNYYSGITEAQRLNNLKVHRENEETRRKSAEEYEKTQKRLKKEAFWKRWGWLFWLSMIILTALMMLLGENTYYRVKGWMFEQKSLDYGDKLKRDIEETQRKYDELDKIKNEPDAKKRGKMMERWRRKWLTNEKKTD